MQSQLHAAEANCDWTTSIFAVLLSVLTAIMKAGNKFHRCNPNVTQNRFAIREQVRVLAAILCAALIFGGLANSATSAPFAGPEFNFGAPAYVAAPFAQQNARIAFNGSYYLAVWDDERDGQTFHIYGTRISTKGTILDPDGIRIDKGWSADARYPSVATDGSNFLIVWTSSSGFGGFGRIINAAGEAAATNTLSAIPGFLSTSSLAWNGTNYLLVWTTQGGDIAGARVKADGTLLDTNGFSVCTATGAQYSASVAALGTNWLVAWADPRQEHNASGLNGDIFATLVAPDGTVLITNGFPVCTVKNAQTNPRLATLDNTCLVVWNDARGATFNDAYVVYGARINAAGQNLDPNGFPIDGTVSAVSSVASDGTNWLVTIMEEFNTMAKTVTPQGLVSATAYLESVGSSMPCAAFGGTNYFAVWHTRRGTQNYMLDVFGARISATGALIDETPYPISIAANTQIQPCVVPNGSDYFVAWTDGRQGDGSWDIYGARVNRDGTVLDPQGIAITSLNTAETNPAVAFNGQEYLVVWTDSRWSGYPGVYAARVTTDGTLLDTNGFLVFQPFTGAVKATVTSVGTNFLVVWDTDTGVSSSLLSCSRVTGLGQVLDPSGIQIFSGGGSAHQPVAASNGTNYLVGWSANYGGTATISPNGTILFSNYPVSGIQWLVSNGANFFGASQGPYGVTGFVYPESGLFSTVFTVSSTFYNSAGYWNAISGNTRDYLMLYSPAYTDSPFYTGNTPVYLTQVSASGRVIHTNGVLAFTNSSSLRQMALAGNATDYLAIYSRPNPQSITRLNGRILSAAPKLLNATNSAGQFSFVLDAPAERAYEIQVSRDLQSWAPGITLSNVNATVLFSTNVLQPREFYRAKLK
jgi:hypothetical protein